MDESRDMMRTIAVVGASGDVGRGIVRAAVARDWRVVAIARSAERLGVVRDDAGSADVRLLPGTLADDDGAARLAAAMGPVDGVVVATSTPIPRRSLSEWTTGQLAEFVTANVCAHHTAARHLLPVIRPDGTFLGIGGGTADIVLPDIAPASMVQAAQRMFYRGLAKESRRNPAIASVRVLELLVCAMVDGARTRRNARREWITDDEVGAAVCDVLDGDEVGPVLTLASPRATVGK